MTARENVRPWLKDTYPVAWFENKNNKNINIKFRICEWVSQ